MSRDNWARLVEAVVRKEQIWQMFHDHSRTPSISTIASEDDPTNHFSGQLTNDSFKALSVSHPVSLRNSVVCQAVINNADSTGPFPRKLFSSWFRRRKPKDNSLVDITTPQFDMGHDVRIFSISEIQAATDNFSQKNILGGLGFHKVYKGRLSDGSLVAIKRFNQETRQFAGLRFQLELLIAGRVVHPNVLNLLGYCITPKEWILIYPLMVHGSVASCLRERPISQAPLNLSIRKRIALGSAKGLAYVHDKCDPKVIHGDVKAANILLDEDFEAVVADFELAKLMDHNDSHVTSALCGTTGHVAPEYYFTGKCTEKIDVYGYGAFLLELITGKHTFDLLRLANDDGVRTVDWVKKHLLEKTWRIIMDPDCEVDSDLMEEEVEQLIQLALICKQSSPMGRPKMSEIVRMLEDGSGLVERWEQWQEEERLRNKFNHLVMFGDDTFNIPPDEAIKQIMSAEVAYEVNQLPPHLISVNDKPLSLEELVMLQSCANPPKKLRPGKYWYDKVSGLWGKDGEKPCQIISAQLAVGYLISQTASNGNTNVMINGREVDRILVM